MTYFLTHLSSFWLADGNELIQDGDVQLAKEKINTEKLDMLTDVKLQSLVHILDSLFLLFLTEYIHKNIALQLQWPQITSEAA